MSQLNRITLAFAFFTNVFCFAQYTDVINSNRPGESMSAFSVGKTIFQTEFGATYKREKHNTLNYTANGFNSDLLLRYGLFASEMEAVFNIQYQNDNYKFANNITNRSGIKKTTLGFKYLFYDPYKKEKKINIYSYRLNNSFKWGDLIPAISIFGGLNLNFSDNKFLDKQEALLDPKLMIITQNQFASSQVFVMNFYVDKLSSDSRTFGYVLTYTKGFNDNWSGFIENKGFKSVNYSDAIFTGGAAYLFSKNTQVDISISKSVKNTPSLLYGGIGVSWRYDENYKDDKIKLLKRKKVKNKKNKKEIVPNLIPTVQANPNEDNTPDSESPEKLNLENKVQENNEPVKDNANTSVKVPVTAPPKTP